MGSCLPGIQYDAPAWKHGAIQCEGLVFAALAAHVAAKLPAMPVVVTERCGKQIYCPADLPSFSGMPKSYSVKLTTRYSYESNTQIQFGSSRVYVALPGEARG